MRYERIWGIWVLTSESTWGSISDIAKINPETTNSNWNGREIRYIDIASVGNGVFNSEPELILYDEAPSRARRVVKHGDVLISTVRPNRRSMIQILNPEENTVASTGFALLRPNRITDSDYLFGIINNKQFTLELEMLAYGAAYPAVSTDDICRALAYLPEEEERDRISRLLNLISKLHNSKLPKIIQEYISSLFRSWFIDFDIVKAKAEGELPYGMDKETAALFPDTFEDSELGSIPAGWAIGTVHDIAKQRKDIARSDVFDDMLPYIGLEHMPRNSIALTEWGVSEGLESNKFRYSKKDILFGKLRPYFHKVGSAPLEGVCSTDILVIQPIDEKLGGFLLPILSSEHFVNFVSGISEGVGLPRTKWEHFKLYKIALPPVEIREKFVSLVDPMLQIIESSIHESKGLEHARDALLPRLMSGELKVN